MNDYTIGCNKSKLLVPASMRRPACAHMWITQAGDNLSAVYEPKEYRSHSQAEQLFSLEPRVQFYKFAT